MGPWRSIACAYAARLHDARRLTSAHFELHAGEQRGGDAVGSIPFTFAMDVAAWVHVRRTSTNPDRRAQASVAPGQHRSRHKTVWGFPMHTTINSFALAVGFYALVVSATGWACDGSCDKAPATDNKHSVACSKSDCGKCPDAQAAAKGAKECLVFDDTQLFDIDKFAGYGRMETGARCSQGTGNERCEGK